MLIPAVLAATLAAPRIEVLTMGQGEHLFERFGHAAICVVPEGPPERALCYNYGTADFSSPPEELGWDFLRGESRFWVSVAPLPRMLESYARADRTILRQALPLSDEEARAVAALLEHDALPENREYLYHHFRDNCATRIRDVVDRATLGRLAEGGKERRGESFRGLARDALAGVPLALILGDLLVGRQADAPVTAYEAMFLPDVLRSEFERQLKAPAERVYERRGPPFPEHAGRTSPFWVSVALLAAAPLAIARRVRAEGVRRAALSVTSLVLGGLGLVVWGVALLSVMPELRINEALVVFLPTDLLLVALPVALRRRYARLRLVLLAVVSMLLAVGLFRQPLFTPLLLVWLPMALIAWEGEGGGLSGGARRVP